MALYLQARRCLHGADRGATGPSAQERELADHFAGSDRRQRKLAFSRQARNALHIPDSTT